MIVASGNPSSLGYIQYAQEEKGTHERKQLSANLRLAKSANLPPSELVEDFIKKNNL